MADANFVLMLRESLEKKVAILNHIIEENIIQKDILTDPESDPDELDNNLEKKGAYVDELVKLDDGFNSLFKAVEDIFLNNRSIYKEEIEKMRLLVEEITDLSTKIRLQETENYKLATEKFEGVKERVKKTRQSQQAVNTYYKNMMKVNYVDPQFMDNKK